MAKCDVCGAPMEANKCGYCGNEKQVTPPPQAAAAFPQPVVETVYVQQFAPPPMVSPKNRLIDLLLCIFIGVLGAHKFYEGKIGLGVLYLFTGGIFGFGVLVSFFSILFGNPLDADGLPIKW